MTAVFYRFDQAISFFGFCRLKLQKPCSCDRRPRSKPDCPLLRLLDFRLAYRFVANFRRVHAAKC